MITRLLRTPQLGIAIKDFYLPAVSLNANRYFSSTIKNHAEEESELESNPFFKKYVDKIKKAKENGVYMGNVRSNQQLQQETNQWKHKIETFEKELNERKQNQSNSRGSKLPQTLEELIHLDLFQDKSSNEIADIWTEYFKAKEAISAVIPTNVFMQIMSRGKESPLFLYPLPKDHGYEFILSQFDGNRCFFTSLINYQTHGDNAPWQLCLTYYTELIEDKDIVLAASEIDLNTMSVPEAQCLAQLQQMFYFTDDTEKYDLVKEFNHSPATFKYMNLVKAVENSNIIVNPPKA